MKFANDRPLADREKAARKLLEIAHTVEPVQDGRIHFEKIDRRSFLYRECGSPAEHGAGLKLAIERIWLHSSTTVAMLLIGFSFGHGRPYRPS